MTIYLMKILIKYIKFNLNMESTIQSRPSETNRPLPYVEHNFPFTNDKDCPYWMKSLLKKKYQLKDVGKVIRYLRNQQVFPQDYCKLFT